MRRVALLLLSLAAVLTACVRNPATGRRQLALISESEELELGREAAEEVRQAVGLVDAPELQAYTARVGLKLAAQSERPELPWSYEVVDDAAPNAFALPGGPIFITRGMLAHLGSEAELSAVLGHETGHITARHVVSRLTQAQLAELGLGLGTVLSRDFARFAELAQVGVQLLFLQYSRDQEREADALGLRYMLTERYDVREMQDVFRALARVEQAAGGRLPVWLSTHPAPEERVREVGERIAALGVDPGGLRTEEATYLRHLQGLPYGPDPRQGYLEGNRYFHPALRFTLELPAGWQISQQLQGVVALSPGRDALVGVIRVGKLSPEQAFQQFFSREGIRPLERPTPGLPANARYFEAVTQEGTVQGVIAFTSQAGTTLQLIGYTSPERLPSHDEAFRATFTSLRELTDQSRLQVRPAYIDLLTLQAPATLAEIQTGFPSSVSLEELARINGVEPDEPLPAGRIIKRILGPPPSVWVQ